jgi:hypothetical protein
VSCVTFFGVTTLPVLLAAAGFVTWLRAATESTLLGSQSYRWLRGTLFVNQEVVVTHNQLPRDVIQAIERGRKIEAIQLLREATGIGLANAKVLVDRAWQIHGPQKGTPSAISESTVLPTLAKSVFLALILFGFYFVYLKV